MMEAGVLPRREEFMADQDAQDINQMMSATADAVVAPPRKSRFLWVVLGCVVVGVGLGVVVYQQSLKPAVKTPSPTPRPTVVATPQPSPIPTAVTPETNVVVPVTNTMTFPKKGKIRIYNNLNNIQLVTKIVTAGVSKTITLPSKPTNTTTPMNSADSTFEVEAGSTATVETYLGSTSGLKLRGWVNARNQATCGDNGAQVVDFGTQLSFVQSKLAGESIFAYQCWEDEDQPGEFNDVYMLWTYVPGGATTASPSPTGSATASSSPVASPSRSPSPSPSRSPSPSPSVATVASPTPTPSPRVVMPDTDDGVPVTGIFEVTVGTISVGLILLALGLLGLLAL